MEEKRIQYQKELTHQKEITTQYGLVQDNERKRLAELLHDEIGNKLNILSLWVNNKDTWKDENSRNVVVDLIPKLIESSRNISYNLYPVTLEKLGLVRAIEELLANIEVFLNIEFLVFGIYKKRDRSLEIQLYRVIQEFMTNVVKHSKASEMKIYIRDTKKCLYLFLSDDGIGFDMNRSNRGMGISNIETRLNSIAALWKWKSKKGVGTRLTIKLKQ